MNDRELEAAAAKTAGIEVHWVEYVDQPPETHEGFWATRRPAPLNRRSGDGEIWAPLTDDGDALRLAVKLRMVIDASTGTDIHIQYPQGEAYRPLIEISGDPYAATRRAIVRAAAAMIPKEGV